MDDAPEISVVVPTYNRSAELRRCLRSVAVGTFPDWECIVVDDGSDPPVARSVVEEMDDPRFRLIERSRNQGVAAAMNDGVQSARGRYLTFCGDDDELSPEFLASSRELMIMSGDQAQAVECSIRYESEDRTWLTPPILSTLRRSELYDLTHSVFVVSLLIRRDALPMRPFDETLSAFEDWDLVTSLDLDQILPLEVDGTIVHVDAIPRLSTSPVMVGGFERLRCKHAAELARSSARRARWAFVLACLKAQHGDLEGSRREMLASARARPSLQSVGLLAASVGGLSAYGRAVRSYVGVSQRRGGRAVFVTAPALVDGGTGQSEH